MSNSLLKWIFMQRKSDRAGEGRLECSSHPDVWEARRGWGWYRQPGAFKQDQVQTPSKACCCFYFYFRFIALLTRKKKPAYVDWMDDVISWTRTRSATRNCRSSASCSRKSTWNPRRLRTCWGRNTRRPSPISRTSSTSPWRPSKSTVALLYVTCQPIIHHANDHNKFLFYFIFSL